MKTGAKRKNAPSELTSDKKIRWTFIGLTLITVNNS